MTRKKRARKRKTLLNRLRDAQPEWTSFTPASLNEEDRQRYVDSALPDEALQSVWINSRYQVLIFDAEAPGVPGGGVMQHLSIKRLDQETVHDWREMQRIKNELCGPNREGVELYPAESRLVDTSNQYHLWVLPEGVEFPFGYSGGRAVSETEAMGNKQRPFEDRPSDMISEEEMLDFLEKKKSNEDEEGRGTLDE